MKIIIPIFFALILLTGTSGVTYDSVFAAEQTDIEEPHVPNHVIISFEDGTTPAGIENFYEKFFGELGISEIKQFNDGDSDDPGDRLVYISHPATKGILQKLANDPRVEFAEPDYIVFADAIPNDPYFGDLWGLHRWSPNAIVVNKGDTIVLKVTNPRGNYHSFSIPEFGVSTSMLDPRGGSETVEFVADKAGIFTFSCEVPFNPDTQWCDPDHAMMTGTLIVLDSGE